MNDQSRQFLKNILSKRVATPSRMFVVLSQAWNNVLSFSHAQPVSQKQTRPSNYAWRSVMSKRKSPLLLSVRGSAGNIRIRFRFKRFVTRNAVFSRCQNLVHRISRCRRDHRVLDLFRFLK